MDEGRASRTAIATAYFRAHHYAHASPKVIEDSLAGALLTAKEREAMERFLLEGLVKHNPELARSGADRATLVGYALRGLVVVLARARYTEDRLAAAMRAEGVRAGDRVAAYMPNLPETVTVFLAAASLGAVFTSASPDFGIQGVLDRFGQVEPKLLFVADGYYYNGKTVDSLGRVAQISELLPSVRKMLSNF